MDLHAPFLGAGADALDILERDASVETFAIARREGVREHLGHLRAFGLAFRLDQRGAKLIAPRPRRLGDLRFQIRDLHRRHPSGLGGDDVVDARQRAVGDLGIEGRQAPIQLARQDVADGDPQRRVEAVARHEHQDRGEAFELVETHEKRRARALLQVENAQRGIQEVVVRAFEKFVARQILHDVLERLAVVPMLAESHAVADAVDLAAQDRHEIRAVGIDVGGEQADEHMDARDIALVVKDLHGDDIEMHTTVHGGALVGLHHEQRAVRVHEVGELGRQRGAVGDALEDHPLRLLEKAQAVRVIDPQRALLAFAFESEAAVAQEGEMVVVQPFQEVGHLGRLFFTHPRAREIEIGGEISRLAAHGLPVRDRETHIAQHRQQIVLQAFRHVEIHLRDFDVHQGFESAGRIGLGVAQALQAPGAVALHRQDRVDQQERAMLHALQLGADRVHQERHVVVHKQDDGAVALAFGDGDLFFSAGAAVQDVPRGQRDSIQGVGRTSGEFVGRRAAEELRDEAAEVALGGFGPLALREPGHGGDHLVDAAVLTFRRPCIHSCPPPVSGACGAALRRVPSWSRRTPKPLRRLAYLGSRAPLPYTGSVSGESRLGVPRGSSSRDYESHHVGLRFSRKASMPSAASRSIMFSVMTAAA